MQNSKNFNEIASDKRWVSMMGVMKGVRQEISQLAPHPDRPDHKGSLSVKDDARGAANDDRNATLGSMMIESFIGANFGVAIGDALGLPEFAQNIDWGNAIEIYDEARFDWNNTDAKNNNKNSFSDQFNVTARPKNFKSAEDKAWERYLNDLPNRRVLEQSLSSLSRDLDRIEKDNMMRMKKMSFSM